MDNPGFELETIRRMHDMQSKRNPYPICPYSRNTYPFLPPVCHWHSTGFAHICAKVFVLCPNPPRELSKSGMEDSHGVRRPRWRTSPKESSASLLGFTIALGTVIGIHASVKIDQAELDSNKDKTASNGQDGAPLKFNSPNIAQALILSALPKERAGFE
ncbi:hypothetical protein BDP27DRAFT_1405171 [Rhodocollybia butyracea]|uniref:Uncharacterized protein n=1 Tax=Rhodocollybia butyracea TaxID=206335 RepID=A0A9P5PJ30_9AGAR|nr:hypothetical protein BDP27DRAFT_1405171 [Rhodocollybia butyracea]